MGLIFPLGLIFLVLSIPIIIFYLLKLRREELTVSSNFLWRKIIEDKQANAPWQKLQKNWLLFLQLLLLLLLAIILSRPFFSSEAKAAGNIVVLLDGSAGMQATDISPNRFTKAKEEVRSLIDNMGSNDKMTLVLMHAFPEVLVSSSSNKGDLRSALDKSKVTSEPVNARSAVTLAAANADRNPGTTIVVVSNGSFARDENLPPLRAKISFVKIGQAESNQAITAIRTRESGANPQLYVGLRNYAAVPATISLQITIDNKPFDTREITIASNDKVDLTLIDLPTTSHIINAQIRPANNGADFLEADNRAWTVRNANPQRLLLVTTGNTFLETFFKRLPNYKVFPIDPADYPALKDKNGYDLYIMDKYSPDVLPTGGGIFLIDPTNSPILPVQGTVNTPVISRVETNDPIMRYADLSDVSIAQANQFEMPAWAHPVASDGNGTPLIIAGERQGQRVVAMAFNLNNSDLALKVGWPVLLLNTLTWLQPTGAVDNITEVNPGEPVSFAVGSTTEQIAVQPPVGGAQVLKPTNNVASFTDTGTTGIYTITRRINNPVAATSGQTGTTTAPRSNVVVDNFVVNLYSPTVSNIKPVDDLAITGTTNPGQTTTNVKTERELWQPIALAVLLLLFFEWYLFYKGFRLPFLGSKKNQAKTISAKGRVS